MKKIHLYPVLAAILFLLNLAGCGSTKQQGESISLSGVQSGQEEAGNREIIVVWDYSRDTDSAVGIETYVSRFNEANETYFVVYSYGYEEGIEIGEYREEILDALKKGEGADILNGDVIENPLERMREGAFVDLGDYMVADGLNPEDYEEVTFEGCKYEGGIYGVNIRVNMSQYSTFFINGNSANKDGAWEFISYLMSGMLKN